MRRMYGWLFSIPAKLDYSFVAPERQVEAQECVQAIIYNMVRLEEILLSGSGRGAEKKKEVLARLKAMGFPGALVELADTLIDDAVKQMNSEAIAAVREHSPQAPAEG